MKIIDYTSEKLNIENFSASPDQAWCIIGNNRSGIELFFQLLAGETPPGTGEIHCPDQCGVFSFSSQQALFEQELKNDDSDYMDKLDPGTLARSFLKEPQAHEELIQAFDMAHVLDQGYRQLSTGQSRKLLMLAQITRGVDHLLIQAPYEGLDPYACKELDKALAHCIQKKMGILVTLTNPEDLPAWATHIGVLHQGRLILSGPKEEIVDKLDHLPDQDHADFKARVEELLSRTPREKEADRPCPGPKELIRIENAAAGYASTPVFTGLNLTINTGDHTLVCGPNGSGKSTLLQMITGDHPACYQNDLWLFGIKRGTGESIWELKQKMGIVSHDLHRNYIVPGATLDCVISGLYDSIGLYTAPSAQDRQNAMDWLSRISLENEAATPFRSLTYADQRLVLIARSLIKLPDLLVLDEPTQGLDHANREAILDFLKGVAQEKLSTILYVSHRQDEYRDFFTQKLDMGEFKG